jgi:hypothetical protein
MQVAIKFHNETIAKKILWILQHFKDDGIEIIEFENLDDEVINNFKEGLQEVKLIQQRKIDAKLAKDFLNEL